MNSITSKINFLISCCLIFFVSGFAQTKKAVTKNEIYEWSHSWIINKPDSTALPGVLLIGDSHVERYQPVVASKLKGSFDVSKITTSKSMGDPAFIEQLKGLMGNFKFDVICFNNGLHGVGYTPEQYAAFLPELYALLKKNNSAAKIFWVTTTARRVPDSLDVFDKYNNDVTQRNTYVTAFCAKKNISVINFAAISMAHKDYYTKDGIHFNETGVNAQAQLIADEVTKYLKPASN